MLYFCIVLTVHRVSAFWLIGLRQFVIPTRKTPWSLSVYKCVVLLRRKIPPESNKTWRSCHNRATTHVESGHPVTAIVFPLKSSAINSCLYVFLMKTIISELNRSWIHAHIQ